MVSPRWKKVLHDLWGNKTRTALTISSIAVGLFATGMIVNAKVLLDEGMHQGYAAIHPSNGIVRTSPAFNGDFLRGIRALNGVADADARSHSFSRYQLTAANDGANGAEDPESRDRWGDLEVFAVSDFDSMRVNKILPQSGAWPPPSREVLMERSSLALIGAQVGDSLLVETRSQGLRSMRIAGVVHDLIRLPAQFDGSVYVYVSMDTLEWLGEPPGFNELQIVAVDPTDVQTVVNRVKDAVESEGMAIPMDMTANPNDLPMGDVLQAVLLLLGTLGVLSFCLSALLIVNIVASMMAQQVRQIGVMKAVGARADQIILLYLALAAGFGLAALLVAIPLSALGAWALSNGLATLFNFDLPGFRVAPQAVLLQIIIGLGMPVLAAWRPTLAVIRVSAAEAMRGGEIRTDRAGAGWVNRILLSEAIARFAPRPVLLSLRNTFRRTGRLMLTLASLTLGGAIFIGILSVRDSLAQAVEAIIPYRFDLSIAFTQPQDTARIEQAALEAQNVSAAYGWIQWPVRRVRSDGEESQSIILMAAPLRAERILPSMVEGRWLTTRDERAVVISSGMLIHEPDLRVGGELTIKLNGREEQFRIVGMALGMGSVPTLYAGYEDIARITDHEGQANQLLVVTGRSTVAEQTEDAGTLGAAFKAAGIPIGSIQLMTEEGDQVRAIFDIILGLAMAMALLLAVVGGLGLAGNLSISVLERTREIGVMRAIGASDRAILAVFITEGEVIGILSWLAAIGLAIPLGWVLGGAIGTALLQMPLPSSYSMEGVAIWLGAVIILAYLASLWPARNASRLPVREVLTYE